MGKIVAIGGGEIGKKGCSVETSKIDKEAIRLTGKKHPKLLFIPTASDDSEEYCEVIKKHFGKRLGCKIDVLYLIKDSLNKKVIKEKILSSDIIYVGGGNTLKMMNIWKKYGVDKLLVQAYNKDVVLTGLSAGSICWFKYGNSDSRKFTSGIKRLIKVTGIGLINALNCPHYDFERHRKEDLKRMMKNTSGVAIAIDNCCAIEIIKNNYRIISSKSTANAYKVYWSKGKYHKEIIPKLKKFESLDNLLSK